MRAEAAAAGLLGKSFFMYPPIPKTEMPIALADATVAFSLFIDLKPMWRNSANKFFDGLASGTPMALNYGGWQAEALEESGAGIRLHESDYELAAEQLVAFVSDAERLERSGIAARRLAAERFDRDVLADQLYEVLNDVVQEAKAD